MPVAVPAGADLAAGALSYLPKLIAILVLGAVLLMGVADVIWW
jgi:hypothetical protein